MKPFLCTLLTLVALSPLTANAQTLYRTNFNATSSPWGGASAVVTGTGTTGSLAFGAFGTVDTVNTATLSNALRLTASNIPATGAWSVGIRSGQIAVTNTQANLGLITLAFTLEASQARPVRVRVESFNTAGTRTGGLVTTIHPAAPNFYQRYAIDLNTMKPDGAGTFQPTAPRVQFSYEIVGGEWPTTTTSHSLRVDNVQYATPRYYVSPTGSDSFSTGNGLTEARPFRTVQRALNAAQPGEIVVLRGGTHRTPYSFEFYVAEFVRQGAPDAWIVLKNYPGEKPMLTTLYWDVVNIAAGTATNTDTTTSLAYLEVRGLHIRGTADTTQTLYPDSIGKVDPKSNTNGISVSGGNMTNVPHHIRIADNLVEYCPGGGIGAGECDWVTIENNVSRFNCWWMIYAGSGISVLSSSNFDTVNNNFTNYKVLVRNNTVYRNECFQKWAEIDKYSDGNGIIIDLNFDSAGTGSRRLGRTLVQNNLSFDNGGSGIHAYKADHVDIIGNTAYLNSASVHLEYAQIFANQAKDIRIVNNIMVAPVANLAAGEKREEVNADINSTVLYANNLYFGGNRAPVLGDDLDGTGRGVGDVIGDPRFVNPTRNGATADFRIRKDSPAAGKGGVYSYAPYRDLFGVLRSLTAPSKGAYEYTPRLPQGR